MGMFVFVDGQVLTASQVNSWLQPLAACRASDSTPNLTTTFVNDDTLSVALAGNSVYQYRVGLRYSGSVTGGMKWRFAGPSGASGIQYGSWFGAGGGSFFDGGAFGDTNTTTIGTLNALYDVGAEGTVTTSGTAGNLVVQFAEGVTDAVHGTFLRAGSFLIAQKIG